MQICKLIDGQPTLIQPIPAAYQNISNPQLSDLLAAGWRQYCPLAERPRYIRTTVWVDDGRRATETVTATFTPEELAAQAQEQAAAAEATRIAWEADQAAAQAAEKARQANFTAASPRDQAIAESLLKQINELRDRHTKLVEAINASKDIADLQTKTADMTKLEAIAVSAIAEDVAARVTAKE
jgi:hypothetical protein